MECAVRNWTKYGYLDIRLPMQVPLFGNEDTLNALQEWESQQSKPQELPQHVQSNMRKAQAAVAQRQAHEEAVAPCKPANEELLAAYMAYIQLEQVFSADASSPGMVQDNLGHFPGYMLLHCVLPHAAAMHLKITFFCKAEATTGLCAYYAGARAAGSCHCAV